MNRTERLKELQTIRRELVVSPTAEVIYRSLLGLVQILIEDTVSNDETDREVGSKTGDAQGQEKGH